MSEDSLLPGAAPLPPPRGSRPSILLLAVVGLLGAAVVGLLIGAVWGLSGGGGPGAAGPAASSPPPGPSPAGSSSSPGPSPDTPSPPAPDPSPDITGGFPPAPGQSEQTSRRWHLGDWQVTNSGGVAGMQAAVSNEAATTRSANLVLFVYAAGQPMARMTAAVTDVPAGDSVQVTFSSTDNWAPGDKTMILQVA